MKTAVPTKNPVVLYYRDPLECLQSLMRNPLFKDHISFCPFRLYESAAKATRTYTEWLSGDAAWFMQVRHLVFSESRMNNLRIGCTAGKCNPFRNNFVL